MTRQQLKAVRGLKDDVHFRKAYLLPALEAGLIEMTIPRSHHCPYNPTSSSNNHRQAPKGGQAGRRQAIPVLRPHQEWDLC
jgi:hypothetical protein